MRKIAFLLSLCATVGLWSIPASAQTAIVIPTCGGQTLASGYARPISQDTTGNQCVSSGGGAGSSVSIVQTTPGTTNGVVTNSGSVTNTSPGSRTLITLDVKTVTTGGTAVTALTAGHRTAGGVLCNPQNATINLGINEIGTAAGTTGSGDTTFIVPGQCYNVTPASTAVSVISSDSAHPFSGYGLN